ncbi:hypothetical protein CYY_007082 [Polysphondylium violaceum]|uniref:HPP transmembrane region domain-containing protein n=1 Tax=Polysphondylium violaceum TaxID=133409 RepID=A0A8J4UR48_9MYCE|nr:hypothetical protein CYY_007082 [Polysphondylium violaceum]
MEQQQEIELPTLKNKSIDEIDENEHQNISITINENLSTISNLKTNNNDNDDHDGHFKRYWKKWLGKERSPKMTSWDEMLFSFLGSVIGIGIVGTLHYHVLIGRGEEADLQMMIGSFAATAVIIYACGTSPLAQPRNLLLGHFVSAIIGVSLRHALKHVSLALASALAVSISIVVMQILKCLHPPGGATALIAVMSVTNYRWANYFFVFMPVTTGALIMLLVALVVNNLSPKRSYPIFWW